MNTPFTPAARTGNRILGGRRNTCACGFTLVELMVVLVVLAIAGAMVSFSVSARNGFTGHSLESAAEHLSAQLEEARWRAISTGRRIALEVPQSAPATQSLQWREQKADGLWHIREMPGTTERFSSVAIQIALPRPAAGAPSRLILGPEPVTAPACVLLTHEGNQVTVASDGIAPFAVQRDTGC